MQLRRPPTVVLLCLYSVAVCAVALGVFSDREPEPLLGTRMDGISASIAVLDRGGPPLLGSDRPYRPGIAARHLEPVPYSDDQGIYVYLPALAKLTGEDDPATLMKWFFMGCFALLVLVYPLLFYGIFRSSLIAVVAPLVLLWKFSFTQTLDLYWILAWIMLLGIPGLVLAYKWWRSRRRSAGALLVALMIAASFASSIRLHAGLPILIGALGIVAFAGVDRSRIRTRLRRFWTVRRWWVRPALGAVLVVAYLSISTGGLSAIREYRDHVIDRPHFGAGWPTQHPLWHNAYIGLGYLPNPYGIEWNDAVSIDAVERARPGTGYLTNAYEATLRRLYVDIARDDPGLVLRNYWIKARSLVADAMDRFWVAFVLLPLAAMVGRQRRLIHVALLVAIPAAVLSTLGPILTLPVLQYELGWLGIWGALLMLAVGSLWVTVRDGVAARLPPDLTPLRVGPDPHPPRALRERFRRSRVVWVFGAAVVLTAAVGHVARPAPPPSSITAYQAGQSSSFVDSNRLHRPGLRTWNFVGKLPTGWSNVGNAFLERDRGEISREGLYVRSPMVTTTAQLTGPTVRLGAGTYELLTLGRSLAGGFGIRVVRADGSAVTSSHYSSQQRLGSDSATRRVNFSLAAPTRVHVVVTSWSSFPNASAWILWEMKLLARRGAAARAVAARDRA